MKGVRGCVRAHQSVLADDEDAFSAVDLSEPHLFVESAVSSHDHGDAVWEAALRDFRGRAQHRCGQVIDLQT